MLLEHPYLIGHVLTKKFWQNCNENHSWGTLQLLDFLHRFESADVSARTASLAKTEYRCFAAFDINVISHPGGINLYDTKQKRCLPVTEDLSLSFVKLLTWAS